MSEQNFNFSDYKSVLNDIGILEYSDHVKNRGNRIIYKAYRYYLGKLEAYDLEKLLDLITIINKVTIVKIEVNSNSDAFNLFESLNNRGVPLTAIDLIKNKILAEFDKKGLSIESAFNKWREVVQNLEDYYVQEIFLRHYYNAFKWNEKVKIENKTKALRSNIIQIYEKLIKKDLDFIFTEIHEKSRIYGSLLNNGSLEKKQIFNDLEPKLRDLMNVRAAPAYMLLLFLFSFENKFDIEFFGSVIDFLISYFVRRNLTDFPGTRNLDQIFMDLIEELSSNVNQISYEYIASFLKKKDRIASEELFIEKLNDDIYEINSDLTRFILSKIEEKNSATLEIYVDFWERDKKGKLIWTVEHILPEGRNIPEPWVDMIASGDRALAKKIQNDSVHKIGNLTLTGYNPYLSNFDFYKKRDRVNMSDKNIGYKNGLFLNKELKDKDCWDEESILQRTKKLTDIALKIFSI